MTVQPACSRKISALRRIVLLSSITMTFTPDNGLLSGKIPPRLTPRPCVRATARLPGHRLAFDKPVEAVTYIAMPAGEMHRNKALQRAFFRPIAANATELSTVETCSSPEKEAICRVI